ncbi:hypothetical protein PPERSA_04976 [Pseudocohnilembus persalinus]|uniref:Uncharacterized protein n=1 Tax=Pseudocohnilembus persalinus TaxID=266149 RepID=A0A0V0QVW5_PSEPJ|nr:hypothetical protein PPERSA_04976 [Pseudocohnilembus persalinus]|eukprot:KRX06363.1 hypothetical protein PPERSA_04976 [Pseudocohnilembus persalinus]
MYQITNFFKECITNDKKFLRKFSRYFTYKIQNFEYYRLTKIRAKMIQHKYVDKQKMMDEFDPKTEEWKWVLHIKPTQIKKYGRYWKPKQQQQQTQQENQNQSSNQ